MKEKLIESEPKLRGMDKMLLLLEAEEMPDGESVNWKELHERVKPYHSMLELTDNVRDAVREYVALKIPKLKEEVSSLRDLDDKDLSVALADNWFEMVEDDASGQRREVLLAVAAHIIKRIEVRAEKELLKEASPEQLKELDLEPSMRDLLMDVLDTSNKVDPLFVRLLAYIQLSKKPPKDTSPTGGIYLADDPVAHTMAELFPHETQFIAKRFSGIAEQDAEWKKHPGGSAFGKYLEALSKFYETRDPDESQKIYGELIERYKEVIATDFPVIVTPTTEARYTEPYFDPEIKVSVSSAETKKEEQVFREARDMMAKSLGRIDAEEFSGNVRGASIKTSIVLGGFGSSLKFPGVAQEAPVYSLFLNEQIRTYDARFPEALTAIDGSDKIFSGHPEKENRELIGRMSRMGTMLHEFSHPIAPWTSKGGKRLGEKPLGTIDEVKAETLWRALIPQMIEQGLEGTEEQWAEIMLVISLTYIKDQPDGDSYYSAGVYGLNDLLKKGIIKFENKKVTITDLENFYTIMRENAREVLSLYEDETMTERKAAAWLKDRCIPSKDFEKCIKYVRSLKY